MENAYFYWKYFYIVIACNKGGEKWACATLKYVGKTLVPRAVHTTCNVIMPLLIDIQHIVFCETLSAEKLL